MSRQAAIENATHCFDSGEFEALLDRLVGYRTESQDPAQAATLRSYLREEIRPWVERLGFTTRIVENPVSSNHPFLVAHRIEDDNLPTLLTYGHADVQLAHAEQWRDGLDPWQIVAEGGRWYGRGVADNKGQHAINLSALEHVLTVRDGRLGYNVVLLMETGEESGSPGLSAICTELSDDLAADLFIASDGPRLSAARPTVFLGARGTMNFTLSLRARDRPHHSGNWGGLLRNPATILSNAVASMMDQRGQLLVERLRPQPIPGTVRSALADVDVDPGTDGPSIDEDWGEPGLSPSERVFGWNTLEVLAMVAGDPDGPVNAIPPTARVHCQLRFVVGLEASEIEPVLRAHLDEHGFELVEVTPEHSMEATRLDPDDPWVSWATESLQRTTATGPAVLPNLGGSLPNSCFADVLGLPTVWVPHSYPGCSQHAPNEHLPSDLVRESLQVMAGLFWDLAEVGQWPPPVDGSSDSRRHPESVR